MNLISIKSNPENYTTKDHANDLINKLQHLLVKYETILNEKEIRACIIAARFRLRLDSEVKQ